MGRYHGQFIALSTDYNMWLTHGRHHSVFLIHMIVVSLVVDGIRLYHTIDDVVHREEP